MFKNVSIYLAFFFIFFGCNKEKLQSNLMLRTKTNVFKAGLFCLLNSAQQVDGACYNSIQYKKDSNLYNESLFNITFPSKEYFAFSNNEILPNKTRRTNISKFDNLNNLFWQKSFLNRYDEAIYGMFESTSKDILYWSKVFNQNDVDFIITKLLRDGNLKYKQKYQVDNFIDLTLLCETNDEYLMSIGKIEDGIFISKLKPNLRLKWSQTISKKALGFNTNECKIDNFIYNKSTSKLYLCDFKNQTGTELQITLNSSDGDILYMHKRLSKSNLNPSLKMKTLDFLPKVRRLGNSEPTHSPTHNDTNDSDENVVAVAITIGVLVIIARIALGVVVVLLCCLLACYCQINKKRYKSLATTMIEMDRVRK